MYVPLGGLICSECEWKKVALNTKLVWIIIEILDLQLYLIHSVLSVLRHCVVSFIREVVLGTVFFPLNMSLKVSWRILRDPLETFWRLYLITVCPIPV